MSEWITLALIAAGAGGIAWAVMSALQERASEKRLETLVSNGAAGSQQQGFIKDLLDKSRNDRKRKLEDTLRQMQEQERKKKKRVSLRQRLQRAGLHTTERNFYMFFTVLGVILAAVAFLVSLSFASQMWAAAIAVSVFGIALLGLPFWLLNHLTRRRMNKFLHHLPDAIELMVRGLRSGLPINDAMRTIAEEVPDPVGPEFLEVVEGQKLGIPMEQGLERMYERVPLPEVNFLSIVIAIQRETGGNLSEALSNLANVLRSRKAMKLKVKAISQEAKVSAIIIGSVPFFLIGAIAFLNPDHLRPLFNTTKGNIVAFLSMAWMIAGVVIMRTIINIKI